MFDSSRNKRRDDHRLAEDDRFISVSSHNLTLQAANPWEQDNRSVADARNCLILADKMGVQVPSPPESSCQVGDKLSQLPSMKLIAVQQEITNKNRALHQESSCQVGDKLSQLPSMKLIAVQQEITNKNRALHQVRQAIAAASLEAEITDFLHCRVIERRVDMVNRLCTDLDMVLNNMNVLLHRFHKPFVGDHIRMDAAYHKCAKDVFSQLVPTLNDLVVHMNNITWAANSDFLSSQLEPLLAEIQSLTASVQMSCHVLSQMNKGVERLSARTHVGSTKLDITQDSMHSGPSMDTHTSAIHHRTAWGSAHKAKQT